MLKRKFSAIIGIPVTLSMLLWQPLKASASANATVFCGRDQDNLLFLTGTATESSNLILAYRFGARFSDGPSISRLGILPISNQINTGNFRHPNQFSQAFGVEFRGGFVTTGGVSIFEAYDGCPSPLSLPPSDPDPTPPPLEGCIPSFFNAWCTT